MNRSRLRTTGHGFGTAPVFLAAISTILGAILFLRFGYAVGHVGMFGAVLVILLGHLVTIPTGLAVAEIATNLKVEGGGEYYIVSRSFGATVGGAIGISLYLSQAISVAFYLIAFAEAFRPVFAVIESHTGFMPDPRMVSLPAAVILLAFIIRKGAGVGVGVLWVVAAILAVALGMFFLGRPTPGAPTEIPLFGHVADPDDFFKVFAIIFPAFTGMTAGVGLSGDLRNPRRSIPLGTLAATVVGMIVYLLICVKMSYSGSPEEMASDQFFMARVAVWGPIIPIGLAAATLSSAIGSILVAPRTLQALAVDRILPVSRWNRLLRKGKGDTNEPVTATLVTAAIVLVVIAAGNVNFVAQLISMFFMITYGALCLISFLEHFAGNPSYRPTFRTRWYFSALGAAAAFIIMFRMQPLYSALAVTAMVLIYIGLRRTRRDERDLAAMITGVLFQSLRRLQILIQKQTTRAEMANWRPSFVAITRHSLSRLATFDLLRWISHHYGFGTYIHFVEGELTVESHATSKEVLHRLIDQTQATGAGTYVDTIISPSFKTAVSQIVQLPGIAGMENNSILFEFNKRNPEDLDDIIESFRLAAFSRFNVCILRSSEHHFGYHRTIHVWLTAGDLRNANLMIILAYIIAGHPEWRKCEIKLFAAVQPELMREEIARLSALISTGRIPISLKNVQRVPLEAETTFDELVCRHSHAADLVITGLSLKKMRRDKGEFLQGFKTVQDILFVRAGQEILITRPEEAAAAVAEGFHTPMETIIKPADSPGAETGSDDEAPENRGDVSTK
ncbi:amino acid permease [bacterium]|nr:amino acid permease [bacterium]MBU1985508.1 amino acid permease [bacterium]